MFIINIKNLLENVLYLADMLAHACTRNTWEAEAELRPAWGCMRTLKGLQLAQAWLTHPDGRPCPSPLPPPPALLKTIRLISKAGYQGLFSYLATLSSEIDYQGPAISNQKPPLADLINMHS